MFKFYLSAVLVNHFALCSKTRGFLIIILPGASGSFDIGTAMEYLHPCLMDNRKMINHLDIAIYGVKPTSHYLNITLILPRK